ncbi:hypothetical protein PS833_05993 [Pseudomonas fluorescens]|uniref:Uncharacterized protein n=1 Tax=Pseudomonas fluorescens TaxID=294 RepID=A0A5E7FT13_PSEFL|nr:hypothetical protein PS833_05993 [Pseudomonas fluorescens]
MAASPWLITPNTNSEPDLDFPRKEPMQAMHWLAFANLGKRTTTEKETADFLAFESSTLNNAAMKQFEEQ